MTNPQTPQHPQEGFSPAGTTPPFTPQQAGQQPSGDSQPYAPQGGYAQQPYPQQNYQQPYPPQPQAPQFTGQYPGQQGPQQPPAAPRVARPKTDENGVPFGIGKFSIREVAFLAASIVVFLASILPFLAGDYSDVFGYASAWAPAPWVAIPSALVLAAAAALVVIRRLAPNRPLRVGSLSVDQFSSAASVVTAGFYLGALFLIAGFPAWFGGGSDLLTPGAGIIVGLLFSLVAVVCTTLAPVIPFLSSDFARRPEIAAHRIARPAAAVPVRPRAERPAQPAAHPGTPYPGQPGAPLQPAGPGEFAAYQRKGSVPLDPSPREPQPAEPQHPGNPNGVGTPPVVDPRNVGLAGPVTLEQPREPGGPSSEDEPVTAERSPVESVTETGQDAPAIVAPVAAETADAHDSESEAVESTTDDAPAPLVTFVEPVAAEPTAVLPVDDGSAEDDLDSDGSTEVGPVSAVSHVSARAAAGDNDTEAPTEAFVAPAQAASGEQPTAVFSTQPFWVYSPVSRAVVDEHSGGTVFEIGPSAWALAIVDRGSELVIRHDDGRIGVLRDLAGITRG
ncbi:hypothetical protein IWX78_000900 [Mycetocola sp. CAN_C7]|uniref:hypothetical protein n=1 Tax=Mycetocola sp. CAN_C7 TaxID=2787724 RepID=UPI0018CACA9B